MTVDERIKRIQDIMAAIEPNKMTILTGSNGSGKSLVRKQVCFNLARKLDLENTSGLIASVSMQLRTESQPFYGALSGAMHDCAWSPTSLSTYDLVKGLIDSAVKSEKKKYLIIDEPEIGMSRESQLGFILYLQKRLPEIMDSTYGLLVITHSELIVDALKDNAVFLNMDDENCTADDWIMREVIPTDFEALDESSTELFKAIRDYSKYKEE